MAAVTMAPGLPESRVDSDSDALSTIADPRSPLTSPELSRSSSTSLQQHPDLSNEVAALSNKLIRAINHQTDLDDTLVQTRQELDEACQRVKQLEATTAEHDALVASGELMRRSEVQRQKVELMDDLAHEQKRRGMMEKDKRGMEQELESLTTALFEEANQMVAAARKEGEAADKRSDQLRAQLNETELLLATHQEQLAQLKAVMQQMSIDREGSEINAASSTSPSTPALGTLETMHQAGDPLQSPPTSNDLENIAPAAPTSFSHLLSPVLRTDLQAYDDFHALLALGRKSSPNSRVPSGSFGNLTVTNLSHLAAKEHQHTPNRLPSKGSTSSLSTPAAYSSSPITPSSTNSSVSTRDIPVCAAPLKETRFYKRALTEDIEPTLRLDTAPGLSWLARRTVINSMAEGSLVVEPMPTVIKHTAFACSLCGENRKDGEHARTHRFRTSENDHAQRYPLCGFCLNRVRASCDFLGFLRMVKDGHWKADDDESEFQAWEECVRLRERMFWARIGGGVVPALTRVRESPRTSVEQDHNPAAGADQEAGSIPEEQPDPSNPRRGLNATENTIPTGQGTTSVGQIVLKATDDGVQHETPPQPRGQTAQADQETTAAEQLPKDLHGTVAEVSRGLGIEDAQLPPKSHAAKDSITSMPGAFE